jgi:hypothetical protein
LLFQGQEGNRLKEVILNQSSKSSDLFTDSIVNHEFIPCASNNDNLLYASQTVAKTAKISMISDNTRSKSEVTETISDCSTLEDLQDFIDFSYQNILPLNDNVNLIDTSRICFKKYSYHLYNHQIHEYGSHVFLQKGLLQNL